VNLNGRCALVTGAGSGLGRTTAEALHEAGASVILADISVERVEALATHLGSHAFPLAVDVRNPEQVLAAIEIAKNRCGTLHVTVNCAGVAASAKTLSSAGPHSLDLWRQVIDINLTGTFNVLRLAAAQMTQNCPDETSGERGVIINTASITAFDGQRGQAAYAASKAGVIGLALPVARDMAEYGVRCVSVAPGLFETPLLDAIPDKGRQALQRGLLYPCRPGRPTEFAALVRHIIENPYLNGTCLRLDGGSRLPA
jgi:NAD(P)-dependent dehydrogenase (short-subunit alcohol dehydrogenase family)